MANISKERQEQKANHLMILLKVFIHQIIQFKVILKQILLL